MSNSNFISAFADAITRQEGYFPGSVAWKNNNPGNIWDGVGNGKTSRIWPNIPIDSRGFLVFSTPDAGRAALERDLTAKMNAGLTLDQAIAMYAPPNENNTGAYQNNVSAWLGVSGSTPLKAAASSWSGGSAGGSVPVLDAGAAPPDASAAPDSSASAPDSSVVADIVAAASAADPGLEASPLVIGGAALLAAAALWKWL